MIGEPFELGATHVTTTSSSITEVEGANATAGINAFKSYKGTELTLRPNVLRA